MKASPTLLITGANRGLGLEFAKQFQQKGYQVIATARNPSEASELNALGIQVEPLDTSDPESLKKLAHKLKETPIDILINNAGVYLDHNADFLNLTPEQLNGTFAVNSTSPIMVTQALFPHLKKGNLKQIINISSQMGSIENNSGGSYAYRSSKAALNQLTKTLAIELDPLGFTVIALHPGWVQTDMGGKGATYTPQVAIEHMIEVIGNLSQKNSGQFLDLNGQNLPW